ncbi:hypothetical protein GCM10011371_34810 [Novosphingobium marinum]|uniref:Uncharacterized protein n=1 Tax=Novosphingobium marinum TaxID=1514948 RepID=A0A7Y9Y223_9SPHN|nr:hypothetical protein [Novosphingobium marinum]NYH97186.1 hypothetical protein [Novosphingobium marinum]GGC44425.1 hypothetical protein GCM10011371_34810 [Novosphingobium marinum]
MTEEARPVRSEAARAASRRNGKKGKGPKTPLGKLRSSRNAFQHGLRARRALPPVLPEWLREIEDELVAITGAKGPGRHEHLDRALTASLLLQEIDAVYDAMLLQIVGDLQTSLVAPGITACESEATSPEDAPSRAVRAEPLSSRLAKELKKLHRYRRRFRGQRDNAIKKMEVTRKRLSTAPGKG